MVKIVVKLKNCWIGEKKLVVKKKKKNYRILVCHNWYSKKNSPHLCVVGGGGVSGEVGLNPLKCFVCFLMFKFPKLGMQGSLVHIRNIPVACCMCNVHAQSNVDNNLKKWDHFIFCKIVCQEIEE